MARTYLTDKQAPLNSSDVGASMQEPYANIKLRTACNLHVCNSKFPIRQTAPEVEISREINGYNDCQSYDENKWRE